MKKIVLISLLIILIAIQSIAQETIIKYLSGTGNDQTVEWEFKCTEGQNSGKWTTIAVPSCWELQGFGKYYYGWFDKEADERGLYKHRFFVPNEWKNKTINIVFEAAMTDTYVKINGKSAGDVHQGGFYQFEYDITPLVKFGKDNLLEVEVHKVSSNESVNMAERKADYWVFGGIYRPVYLKAVPRRHITRVAIDARAEGDFTMDVFHTGAGEDMSVTARVIDLEGKKVGEPFSSTIESGSSVTRISTQIKNVSPWSPEFPDLYEVEVTLADKKGPVHTIRQRFGFRTIEFKYRDGIYVNGTRIKFRGVNRHVFWPESGRTTSKSLSIKDVQLMKEMNMNAVRMSHYPPDVHFLDACDSLGLFVLDELAGWQAPPYDTDIGKKLVKEMVTRDVNHPCIVIWDNGNEGGWNTDLDREFAKYDIQGRHVIHPWEKFDGTDTDHYKPYNYGNDGLYQGREIFFPTEILHGLYDGGHGAGLYDHWNLMQYNPLSAGCFLWCLIDEGVVRTDMDGWIDTDKNHAPDGILGPYREKEGSFYSIKEIWSPVNINQPQIPATFDGILTLENRYFYTNLNQCKFELELVTFSGADWEYQESEKFPLLDGPDVPPGLTGKFDLQLPWNWKEFNIMNLTAYDPHGMEIHTWTWPLTHPGEIAKEAFEAAAPADISVKELDDRITVTRAVVEYTFDKNTGMLQSIRMPDGEIPFNGGPVIHSTHEAVFSGIDHTQDGDNVVVMVDYEDEETWMKWTFSPRMVELDYSYRLQGTFDYAGISFDFPDTLLTEITYLGDGPYRVWKNRMQGPAFGIWTKEYNNTVTGESWDYHEFKGYYSNFYSARFDNKISPFYIFSCTEDIFLHLFTPDPPSGAYNNHTAPPFPEGDISFLHGIPPIGTKFRPPEDHGPSGQPNMYDPRGPHKFKTGKLYFLF